MPWTLLRDPAGRKHRRRVDCIDRRAGVSVCACGPNQHSGCNAPPSTMPAEHIIVFPTVVINGYSNGQWAMGNQLVAQPRPASWYAVSIFVFKVVGSQETLTPVPSASEENRGVGARPHYKRVHAWHCDTAEHRSGIMGNGLKGNVISQPGVCSLRREGIIFSHCRPLLTF